MEREMENGKHRAFVNGTWQVVWEVSKCEQKSEAQECVCWCKPCASNT